MLHLPAEGQSNPEEIPAQWDRQQEEDVLPLELLERLDPAGPEGGYC